MRLVQAVGVVALLSVVAACGDKEEILRGERIGVREALDMENPAGVSQPGRAIRLPAPVNRADQPQPGGSATHFPENLALSAAPQRIWSVSIGSGDDRRHRITATPVVAGGRIFAMDSRSRVSAVSTAGATLWTADLTPLGERSSDATGGGLAYGGGRLFATTGFGSLVALDPETGAELWTQRTDAPVDSAAAYRDGIVYIVSRDNRAWAIKAENGRVLWQLPGTPAAAGIIGGASPAVSDRIAIFPFASAELVATLRQSGVRVWAASVAGERQGRVYATVDDIGAAPVIAGQVVYTGNQAGRAVALEASSGERIWTADQGVYGMPVPVGGSVFFITDQAQLVRLDARSGEEIWTTVLPYYTAKRVTRRRAIYTHYGPVLAGGRLWVASDDGALRAFSPETGVMVVERDLPGGGTTPPVVAGGTMYVVSGKGQLHAFR